MKILKQKSSARYYLHEPHNKQADRDAHILVMAYRCGLSLSALGLGLQSSTIVWHNV